MSNPVEGDLVAVKRIGRYLQKYPVCWIFFRWQDAPTELSVMSDADWANCTKSRRSTSGGCVFHGSHLVGHWSRTQQIVALSSAESELNALCKATQEGLGAKYLSEELGQPLELKIYTDASAALGVVRRHGSGKIKHLQVRQLWIREHEETGNLKFVKIPRDSNLSDLLTHHWSGLVGTRMLREMGIERRAASHSHDSVPCPARGGVGIQGYIQAISSCHSNALYSHGDVCVSANLTMGI